MKLQTLLRHILSEDRASLIPCVAFGVPIMTLWVAIVIKVVCSIC